MAPSNWNGEERRHFGGLSEVEIDHIAEKAAERALAKVYQEVGKSILSKLFWIVGVAFVAVALWLAGTGHIK